MKIDKLPVKLSAEPLVDAVCEIRFTSIAPASSILPGLLFKELGGGKSLTLEPLPASQIPTEMRQADPMLRVAPLMRLLWENFSIGIGESTVSVSISGSYPGWSMFKPAITRVMSSAIRSGIIQSVDRYSIKYVDIMPSGLGQSVGGLDLSLRIGAYQLTNEVAHVRVEVPDGSYIHIIQAITKAEAKLQNQEKRSGSLIDVDTISTGFDPAPETFLSNLSAYLDDAHARNKRIFFECLAEETLQNLGPIYE